jgi:hypothetical protein
MTFLSTDPTSSKDGAQTQAPVGHIHFTDPGRLRTWERSLHGSVKIDKEYLGAYVVAALGDDVSMDAGVKLVGLSEKDPNRYRTLWEDILNCKATEADVSDAEIKLGLTPGTLLRFLRAGAGADDDGDDE